MKRRLSLLLTAGTIAGAVLPTLAQTRRVKRIGILSIRPLPDPAAAAGNADTLAQLKRFGWEEGRDVFIERRYSMGDPRKHDANAEDLVAAGVDVILALGHERLAAAYKATKSIPIVTMASGLVELGYAKSLARPGGNVTGLDYQGLVFAGKQFELMYTMRPGVRKIGFSGPHGTPGFDGGVTALRAVANTKDVAVVPLPDMLVMADIEPMLEAAKREEVQVLVLTSGLFFLLGSGLQRIQAWATENNVLTYAPNFQRGELLVTYGPNLQEASRIAWSAVDRILRGAKPVDIPIEQPTRYEIVINMKIAKAMGLKVPQSVLLQVTEVID